MNVFWDVGAAESGEPDPAFQMSSSCVHMSEKPHVLSLFYAVTDCSQWLIPVPATSKAVTSVIKHHDQGNVEKGQFVLACGSRGGVCRGRESVAGSRQPEQG